MILLSHPTGNENVRHALTAFNEANLLGEFWTTLSWDPDSPLHRLLPGAVQELLKRRSYPASLRSRTHTAPFREIARLFGGVPSMDAVSLALDKKVAARIRNIDSDRALKLIYAYEDAALQSFQTASERGISRVYDLPIGHWRVAQRLFAEEKEREPEWASTLTGTRDSAEKLARKDEELKLAQRIIVASTFTRTTLGEAPGTKKIDIIPYGAPPALFNDIKKAAGPLKVLFAGSLGQRKGLSYLVKAIEMLNNSVELTLLGRKAAPDCRPLEAATRKYRWIPTLSHQDVLREMSNHDLLLFPSLFEGFGLVVLEAMAQGTPVITTAHTCGPDIIEDGTDGFIVPIRSAEAIAEKIDILSSDRDRLMSMKIAARHKAESHPWTVYRQRLVRMAREVIST
ncbi:MAG: glycosyltransferase family 4 protein [Verrucomicrobiota bacterium]